jgi:hypothetical protein
LQKSFSTETSRYTQLSVNNVLDGPIEGRWLEEDAVELMGLFASFKPFCLVL